MIEMSERPNFATPKENYLAFALTLAAKPEDRARISEIAANPERLEQLVETVDDALWRLPRFQRYIIAA